MKTIQKHLCTVLPRVRSNSVSSQRLYSNTAALSIFDSSAPPPSRPGLSSGRLSIEGKPAECEGAQNSQHNSHSHPPFSLALTQPQSSSGQTLASTNPQGPYALFPYSSLAHPSYAAPQSSQQHPQDQHQHPRPKRQRLKYQLDVGAYGIPKRCRAVPSAARRHHTHAHHHPSPDEIGLSVQVGEDAYFVRGNAMGVADGVGGWSKSHSRPSSTPSALFARRLMHYCSAEVESATTPLVDPAPPVSDTPPPPTASPLPTPSRPHFSFTHHLKPPRRPMPTPPWKWSESPLSSSLPTSWTLHDVFNNPLPRSPEPLHRFSADDPSATPVEDLERDLEEELEELSDGIDVLQILERAYDKTLKAHVVRTEQQSLSPPRPEPSTTQGDSKPLLEGSSTALLAVLDHPPRQPHPTSTPPTTTPSTSTSTPSNNTTTKATESPLKATTATATTTGNGSTSKVECELEECEGEYDAVIKIAHVGDCMGMLVRGDDIVWRSEEMWWDFNTPVQLGPSTSTSVTPRNSATIITLPVKADDILILASDGLSDNLWDEDVLDEVVRFKKTFLEEEELVGGTAMGLDEDSGYSSSSSSSSSSSPTPTPTPPPTISEKTQTLKRKTLAGMLSEALCSRARRVSERRSKPFINTTQDEEDEVPFGRRAREVGKKFCGGKNDDISVVVAVISPRGV